MDNDITAGGLQRLSDADLKVASGEPDVRGWTVTAADGRSCGEVDDLIVDSGAMKVRYLEVDPSDDVRGIEKDEKVFVPVAAVDIDTAEKRVRLHDSDFSRIRGQVPAGFAAQFRTRDEPSTRDRERIRATEEGRLRQHDAESIRGRTETQPDIHRMTRAEEEVQIGKRPVEAGEVRVGKHVETERVEQSVPVAREHVHVERRPVTDRTGSAEIRGSEQEIRVPVVEEEVVVEKRPVVKEEIVVSKEREQGTEQVSTEVRREKFDVHDEQLRDRSDRVRNRTGGE